jgi:pseudouridine-5'-phosphate glycosidase/pseudouridine kinase
MRIVGERALNWSNERSRPEQRLLIAKGENSTLVLKHYPALPLREQITNVTGAGDSFVGSLLAGLSGVDAMFNLEDLDRIVEEAQCAAVLSLSCSEAVSPLLRRGLTRSKLV